MQQKVYIAMALAQDTPIIMMDEPTSFLDIVYQVKLMELARELENQGKAVVLVTRKSRLLKIISERLLWYV